ncbi:MAG TPA: thymidine phosphorylase family protein [Caulobacteraceae bacterium]|jgi:thymidine phosphorylase|nr:thymidine phosphorylase family protein [Caulobacteraceae bacterium]
MNPEPARRPGRALLKARPLPINTFRENMVVLARDNLALRPERLSGARKVEIRAGGRTLLATVVIADAADLVAPDQAGLTQPCFRRLGIAPDDPVEIAPAPPPKSFAAIKAKIGGATLDSVQLAAVVQDLVEHRLSDMEVAAFLVACAGLMTPEETLSLTRAMIAAGARLDWNRPLVVDKHCIGGIPGNRTSLITVPIVAAHGLTIPKTSSRAITSPAGTADVMEMFARVDLAEDQIRPVVDRCGACLVWGGRVNLSPADDVLISVERPLALDTAELMVASILSKKVSAGSTHLLIDLPVGPTAKVRDPQAALRLGKLFQYVADRIGISLDVVVTDGSRPIGRGVGPALEARDVRAVLAGDPAAPADLREKAVRLAGRILEADPALPGGQGEARARELLRSGAALRKLEAIAEAQGPSPVEGGLGPLTYEVLADRSGWVQGVDCRRIAAIARLAGAPTDPGSGIDLIKGVGQAVRAGDPLFRIHGVDPSDFAFAVEAAGEDAGFRMAVP